MIFNNPTLPSYELNQYINKLGNNIVGCEIGVCHAENFCHMLEVCDNITKLLRNDSWMLFKE